MNNTLSQFSPQQFPLRETNGQDLYSNTESWLASTSNTHLVAIYLLHQSSLPQQYYLIHRRQLNFKSIFGLGCEYLFLKRMLVNLSLLILEKKFTEQAFQNIYPVIQGLTVLQLAATQTKKCNLRAAWWATGHPFTASRSYQKKELHINAYRSFVLFGKTIFLL